MAEQLSSSNTLLCSKPPHEFPKINFELQINEQFDINEAQNIFSKNFDLLKIKYKRMFSITFDLNTYLQAKTGSQDKFSYNNLFKPNKTNKYIAQYNIYTFLVLLAKEEVDVQKSHILFTSEHWENFADQIRSNYTNLQNIITQLFRNNLKNYKWTSNEDSLLQSIVSELNPNQLVQNKWKIISQNFNKNLNVISQRRKACQCKERWENILKKSYSTKNWTYEEDLNILKFVLKTGFKWSRLANLFINRTEHNVKNRFYSLMNSYLKVPIRVLKKEKHHLDHKNIQKAIQCIQLLNCGNQECCKNKSEKTIKVFKSYLNLSPLEFKS